MRATFIKTLVELAHRDPRIVLLTGDLGYLVVEPFAEAFPERFINAGVAEQNLVGLSTGLAESGFLPFVYSIATFAALRAYEFIRNGPVQHRLPVRIVGVGTGFEYGANGLSYYALEDVGALRLQPGLQVIAPADPLQARNALLATWQLPDPIYYRLGKDEHAVVPGLDGRFTPGGLEMIRDGTDVALIAMGTAALDAATAADLLAAHGISCAVAVVASVQPAPVEALRALARRVHCVATVEGHYRTGGLGTLVAEVLTEHRISTPMIRCGVATPEAGVGSSAFLSRRHGITADCVAERIATWMDHSGA